jgi:hypothetical protein
MGKVKVESKYDNQFKNHELFIEIEQENLKVYNYRKPNSSDGYMKIIVTGYNVIVSGDYGDAIYGYFSTPQYGLEWLASLNIGYFNGKCEASEVGRNYTEWDYHKAFERFQSYFLSYFGEHKFNSLLDRCEDLLQEKKYEDLSEEEKIEFYYAFPENFKEDDELRDWDSLEEKEKLEFSITQFNNEEYWHDWNDMTGHLNDKNEWCGFVNNNMELISEVFGEDFWEFVYGFGDTIAERCIIHLDAIKRASNARCDMEENKEKVEEK